MVKAVIIDAPTFREYGHGCVGKLQYQTEKEARRAAERAAKRDPVRKRNGAYFCKQCGGWHLGRSVQGPIKKKGKWI